MRRAKRSGNSGETLVEIMVSAFLFLLLMAVMQGAVTFCTNAQHKSAQLRSSNAEICGEMRGSMDTPGTRIRDLEFSFVATSADGQQTGNRVFKVKNVELLKKTITDKEGKEVTFYLYGSKQAGGGSP